MRKATIIICWIIYVSLPAIAQPVVNGSFEELDTIGIGVKGWQSSGVFNGSKDAFIVAKQTDPVNNGRYVIKVQKVGTGYAADFWQTIPGQDLKSGNYLLTASLKANGINKGFARLFFQAFDADGTKLSLANTDKSKVSGTTAWKQVGFKVFVPAGAATIKVGGLLEGDGTALFDNVRLTKLQEPVRQTKKAKKYITDALNIICRKYLFRDSVDTNRIRDVAYRMTANAKTNRDCYEAIKTALWNLGGDHHSRFFTPEEAKYYENDDRSEIEMPVGRVIDGRIGYLTVPAFVSMSEVLMRKYVDSMHALIKRLDGEHITGWIVDVRNNTGGNTVPMLVGIGPVCGEGVMSGGTNLQESGFNLYKAGGLFEKDTCLYKKTDPYQLLHPDPYVAVLTGGQCASSGESVVLAFKNRAKAKSFGEPTAGLTTGTEGFVLTDGAILYLTVGVGIDRKGIVYHGPIKPDVAMKNDPDTMVDEVMEEAIKWLKLVNQ